MASLRSGITAGVLLALLASYPTAAPQFSDWAAPLNLGPSINSPFNDVGPAISKDGLSLYFGSDRPDGFGGLDMWVSQRASLEAPWGPPINLGAMMNTESIENVPALSRDEHWLFFNSNRSGGFGGNDIWASYRQHTKDDFGWQAPVNLGAGVNSPFQDQGASYFANDDVGAPLLFFNSDRAGGVGLTDIYVSQLLADGSFRATSLVSELSSPALDQRPSLRFDGLEVFLFSNRPGSLGNVDIWVATRQTVFDSWSSPTNLGPVVNSTVSDQNPYIDASRRALYFASNRAGGFGGADLYVTTRTRRTPQS
jgi:hypothetical protein